MVCSRDSSESASKTEPRSPAPVRFRFKSRPSRSCSPEDNLDPTSHRHRSHRHASSSSSRRRHRYQHHHRKHRSTAAPFESECQLDPDVAFRESLFDAMADDEGAAYWEGVYGQPIHTYAMAGRAARPGPEGELDRMSDDEYVAYVRARMWEKSHEHVMEERAARLETRRRQREGQAARREEEDGFRARMEESLRRGEERKRDKKRKESWERYVRGWQEIMEGSAQAVPWPTRFGLQEDVDRIEVEGFFRNAPMVMADNSALKALVKAERVKWHPDKMQQRFGGRLSDEEVRSVTAVFQVIDSMWDDIKRPMGG